MFPNVMFTGVNNERDLLSSIQALDKEEFPLYAGKNYVLFSEKHSGTCLRWSLYMC